MVDERGRQHPVSMPMAYSNSRAHATERAGTNPTTEREMTSEKIFLTGATGLIGRWLVPLLTRAGHEVLALVRDGDARRTDVLADIATRGGDPSRVAVLPGDLAQNGL